jgi:hypothetical protein
MTGRATLSEREKDEGCWVGSTGWAGQEEKQAEVEGRERAGRRVGRAVQLGRARGKRGSSRPVMNFCFSFSKIPNNTSFCLFLCDLFRAPKMMKIFV